MAQHTGRVVWFNNLKGYGFLSAEGMPDAFCHFSAIEEEGYKALREGESVEFDIEQGQSGKLQAAHVKRLASNK